MLLTGTFYLKAETNRLWIAVNPETVALDANNVQAAPLQVRIWAGEGSDKAPMSAYLTFRVESVVGSSVTKLYEYKSDGKVSSYSYTIPADKYAAANRISILAHEDAARAKEVDSRQVNIVVGNPVPFPRSEPWSTELTYKNGEYLLLEDVIYMWGSRVPGNTSVSPKENLASATPSGKWKPYQNWPLLATNIALIKFGLIGSAVFKDEYMYSQQGTNAAGAPTEDYREFGTSAFTPNLMLDFLRGIFKGRNVDVDGGVFRNIRSPNGSFRIKENGDIEISGKFSTSLNGGTRIELDPGTNSIKMYNQNGMEVGDISFITEQWNGNVNYLPRVRLRNYHNSENFSETVLRAGSIIIDDNALGNDVYGCLINPSIGLVFFKNGIETKRYENK